MPGIEEKKASIDKILKKIAERVEDLIDAVERPSQFVRDVHRQWKRDGGKAQGKARHSDHFLEDALRQRGTPVKSLTPKLLGRTRIQPDDGAVLIEYFLHQWPEPGATEADVLKYKPALSETEISAISAYIKQRIAETEWVPQAEHPSSDTLPGADISEVLKRGFEECEALITISPAQTMLITQPKSELIGFRNLMDSFWAIERRDRQKRLLIWVLDLGIQRFEDLSARAKYMNVQRTLTRFRALKLFDDTTAEERWKWLQSRAIFIVLNLRDDTELDLRHFKRPAFDAHNISLSSTAPAWEKSSAYRALYGTQLETEDDRNFSIFYNSTEKWPSDSNAQTDLRYFGYAPFLLDKNKKDYQVRGLELPQLHASYAEAFRTVCNASAHTLGITNPASERLNTLGKQAVLQLQYLGYQVLHLDDFVKAY